MPKYLRIGLMVLAGIWVTGVVLVGFGGAWMTNNADTIAEAAVDASGIKDAVEENQRMLKDARCSEARLNFQQMWDKAVDTNSVDKRQPQLDRAEAVMKAVCGGD